MKKIYFILFFTLIITPVVTLGTLTYGNPQLHKYVFMWQAYTYPAESETWGTGDYFNIKIDVNNLDFPPEGYTGNWKTWSRQGRLASNSDFFNGARHGVYDLYDEDGFLIQRLNFVEADEQGLCFQYKRPMIVSNVTLYKDGRLIGKLKSKNNDRNKRTELKIVNKLKRWYGIENKYRQGKIYETHFKTKFDDCEIKKIYSDNSKLVYIHFKRGGEVSWISRDEEHPTKTAEMQDEEFKAFLYKHSKVLATFELEFERFEETYGSIFSER